TFYDGTLPTSHILLDSAANGSLRTKTPEEALELIELVATNQYMNFSERNMMLRNPFGNSEDHRQVHRIVSSNKK
ncbi:hypothetical protein PIB30_102567, partial [Stylosanthes scabra]|nr:hypothetical protein [Stylosanthes scabra]